MSDFQSETSEFLTEFRTVAWLFLENLLFGGIVE